MALRALSLSPLLLYSPEPNLALSPTDIVVQGHRYDIFEDIGCWP